ncbi:hypothetical protein ABLW52_23815, partial [Salmonella enterica]|uniref:hypothetical protein n=1 Tax=Salmonella enterica TaxID=28901 RepID=UPI0032B51D14
RIAGAGREAGGRRRSGRGWRRGAAATTTATTGIGVVVAGQSRDTAGYIDQDDVDIGEDLGGVGAELHYVGSGDEVGDRDGDREGTPGVGQLIR